MAACSGVDMGGILYFPAAEEGAVEPNIKHVIVNLKEYKRKYRASPPMRLAVQVCERLVLISY